MRITIKAGSVENKAAIPHAKKTDCIPMKSARKPNKSGDMVFAILVDRELMLYAASKSCLSTDSAIIVLVIGTVPFVKKPRIAASTEIAYID